jgi:hypothetical protein
MGGSGKWVKSLIGLKKPEKEDCKVSVTGCSWFLEKERERNKDPIFSLFLGVFQIDLRHYDGNIWNARILFFSAESFQDRFVAWLHNLCYFWS